MADPQQTHRSRIRLTAFSHGAGCACKLGPGELAQVLHHLPGVVDPRVLVDAATRDDAAVFRLSDDRALVATVDFFTPIVDDAAQWGAIAAANALSDVYAMGGTPLFALNLVGWPREKLPFELLGDVIKGAAGGRRARGVPVLGGHSIDSVEPLFGMVVIGEVHPDRMLTNAGACAGRHAGADQAAGHRHPHHRAQARRADRGRHGRRGPVDDRAERRRREGRAPGRCERGDRRDRLRAAAPPGQHARRERGGRGGGLRGAAAPAARPEPGRPRHRARRDPAQPRGGQATSTGPTTWRRTSGSSAWTRRRRAGCCSAVPAENEAALLDALREEATPAAAVIGRLVARPAGHIRVARRL